MNVFIMSMIVITAFIGGFLIKSIMSNNSVIAGNKHKTKNIASKTFTKTEPTAEDFRKIFYYAGQNGWGFREADLYANIKKAVKSIAEKNYNIKLDESWQKYTPIDFTQKDYDFLYQVIIQLRTPENARKQVYRKLGMTLRLRKVDFKKMGLDPSIKFINKDFSDNDFDAEDIEKFNKSYYSGFYDHVMKIAKRVLADFASSQKALEISYPHEDYDPSGVKAWNKTFNELEEKKNTRKLKISKKITKG